MSKPDDTSAARPTAVAPTTEDWHVANDAFLSAAITHLRLRLAAFAAEQHKVAEAPRGSNRWTGFFGERSGTTPTPTKAPSQMDIQRAADARAKAEAEIKGEPALRLLGDRFDLTPFEREVLLLCAAVELDTRIAGLCAAAQGDASRDYPTFALALALLEEPAWDVLSPLRPLRYWRLVEVSQPGDKSLTTSALRADEKVTNFLKGLTYLDDRLAPLLLPFDDDARAVLPTSQENAVSQVVRILRQTNEGRPSSVQLVGPDPACQQMVAQRALRALGLTPCRMPAGLLPSAPEDLEQLARLWHRESMLMPIALYLDTHVEMSAEHSDSAPISQFLSRSGGVFALGTRIGQSAYGPSVEVHRPTAREQSELWFGALPDVNPDVVTQITGQFDLNASAILRIARLTRNEAGASDTLWKACVDHTTPVLDRLAERVRPVAGWDDIVLPPAELALLRQLAAQVSRRSQVYDDWGFRDRMNRGLGISALFSGDSGTGKTMAAEVIANALNLRLYRIDLSAVVSKYIGETEKNLRQLFDAAEGGGAILFFDEADALFGKRSEVRDSHDRYANIETSYLLQRVESFSGLTILSTNMRGALDAAFLRRLRFVVNFPYPDPSRRREIWQRAWPPSVPVVEIDYDHLARLNLSGGNITTVAMNAAFMAAEAKEPVTMPLVLSAARAEYEKLQRSVNEGDFTCNEVPAIREVRA